MQDDASNIQAPSGGGILIWLSRLWRNRGGAMAMEFAITAPIFLTFLMAVFEFGRYYLISSTVQYAVEDIGRFAMSHYTREYWADKENAGGDTHFTGLVDSQLEADAGSRIFGWDPDTITVTGTPDTSTDPATMLIVGTTTFNFTIPFVPSPTINIRRQTRVPMIRFD